MNRRAYEMSYRWINDAGLDKTVVRNVRCRRRRWEVGWIRWVFGLIGQSVRWQAIWGVIWIEFDVNDGLETRWKGRCGVIGV